MDIGTWEALNLKDVRIPGFGARSREKLAAAGIHTVADLLAFLPREYLDYSEISAIASAPMEVPVHIRGTVISKKVSITHNKKIPVLEILVDDGGGTLRVVWYNQPFLNSRISKGLTGSFFGKIRFEKLGRTMNGPRFELEEELTAEIQSIYRQIQGLKSSQLQAWINLLLAQMPEADSLPAEWCRALSLPTRRQAFRLLHNPPDRETIIAIREHNAPARHRLIFEEFYRFQQRIQEVVARRRAQNWIRPAVEREWLDAFIDRLPFSLTGDQASTITGLFAQLERGERLHALVQGDVGCGKTVIGLAIARVFQCADLQTALLCPTSVLARQHYETARALLEPLGVRVALVTARSTREDPSLCDALEQGKIDLAIGTHRLIQADLHFARLALVMVDEQHRFGVDQRAALIKKGETPHYLAFSATPIPRSLALTLFGDVQVLRIREKPAARMPIRTILKKAINRHEVVRFVRTRIARGEQVYWVFPLIDGDEEQQEQSARQMYESFHQDAFRDVPLGLVHGRLKKEELNHEMTLFKQGHYRLLIATTVIEVGVDVPAASVMVVESANRFGLSQLHQLRGRVGRGNREAFCFLMIQGDPNRETLKRMRLLEANDDGFAIAEFDLKERGAGHLLGKKQSGLSAFRFGDPWFDRAWMEKANQYVSDCSPAS